MRRALLFPVVLCLVVARPVAVTAQEFTYDLERRGDVESGLETFRRIARVTLRDIRGWSLHRNVEFVRVGQGGDFTLILASPSVIENAAPVCSAMWSCRVGDDVYVNDERWRQTTPTWPLSRGKYRRYVIVHEVGHWLGLDHPSCPGRGRPAPVMMQQSKGLQGCEANVWPLFSDRDDVAARHGVAGWPGPPPDARCTISGTREGETLRGTPDADVICGRGGDDVIRAGGGYDLVRGGWGHDELRGGGQDDLVDGRSGDDLLVGGAADDVLRGGPGADVLFGHAGSDRLAGGRHEDRLRAGTGPDVLRGWAGDDLLLGRAGDDELVGMGGADKLGGNRGDDELRGKGGADVLRAHAGDDFLGGGNGADRMFGGAGDDVLRGWGGGDLLDGQEGSDRCFPMGGDDATRRC